MLSSNGQLSRDLHSLILILFDSLQVNHPSFSNPDKKHVSAIKWVWSTQLLGVLCLVNLRRSRKSPSLPQM